MKQTLIFTFIICFISFIGYGYSAGLFDWLYNPDLTPVYIVNPNLTLQTTQINTSITQYNGSASENLNMNEFDIFNVTNVNATKFYQNGILISNIYYALSNPFNFINDTSWNITAWNGTLAFNSTLSTYDTCMFNTFNSTYDAKVSYNTSWNETHANTLYYPLTNPLNFINSTYNASYMTNTFNTTYNTWAYNQTTPAITYANNNFINMTNTSWIYPLTNALYVNMTNQSIVTNLKTISGWINGTNLNATTGIYGTTLYEAGTSLSNKYIQLTNQSIVTNLKTITGWINSTTMNTTKIYTNVMCGSQTCLANITYNGTNFIIYG